jgi:signal transduction histidine kinase
MAAGNHVIQGVDQAIDYIIERGVIGFVWLDGALTVRRRAGALTAWIEVDASHAEALPVLVGYEDQLAALRSAPGGKVVLPNVGLHTGTAAIAKFDIQIYWLPMEAEYLAVLSHESSHGALELELHQERARAQLSESREAELARVVKRTNEELTRANRDLEEFAYVISHDLRAPLRAMRVTADLLEKDLGADVPLRARENLTSIRMLSRRMGAMMSGLLAYARVGRKQEAIAEIDTARLVRDIIQGIGAPPALEIQRRGAWPVLATLAEPLDVVLRNLVENAVKHHDTREGSIVLSVHDDGAFWRFDVADDGPGIDPSYHEAIFEPFRTVANDGSPDSSGIGLALVKKTADVAGGRIEVESEPTLRRGTTFRLFWPKIISSL